MNCDGLCNGEIVDYSSIAFSHQTLSCCCSTEHFRHCESRPSSFRQDSQ